MLKKVWYFLSTNVSGKARIGKPTATFWNEQILMKEEAKIY